MCSSRLEPITIIDLFVTRRCNFACDYCFVDGKCSKDSNWSILEQSVRFILRHIKSAKGASFTLFGGEPLLRFEAIADFLPYSSREFARKGKKIDFSVTTNASLATPEIMQFFRGYQINLLLSLDGARDSHNKHRKFPDGRGTFDTIAANLPMMKYFQPWLGARVTPMPDTVSRLKDDVLEIWHMGINQFIVGCATGAEWPLEGYETFIAQMKLLIDEYIKMRLRKAPIKLSTLEGWNAIEGQDMSGAWGCSAGRYRISIDVDGAIQACAKIQGACGGRGFLPLGNVFDGFTDEGLKNRKEFYKLPRDEREKCFACEAKSVCLGGCPATNFCATGSIHSCPESDCRLQLPYLDLRKHYLKAAEKAGLSIGKSEPDAA